VDSLKPPEETQMKMLKARVLLAVAILVVSVYAQTPQKEEPANKLIEFHMALIKRGPRWSQPQDNETPKIYEQHVSYAMSLIESGKAVIAGPVRKDQELFGVYILRAKSADEAKSWAMSDPAVGAGYFIAEMHPWWSEDVMKKIGKPDKMTTAYLAFSCARR
jgi:uncharacterized protein YciI